MITKGVTIPTDVGFSEETKKIAKLWGADAVRNCDGTVLPPDAKDIAEKVYYTYFVVRGDNEWADAHPEEQPRAFLLSERVLAKDTTVKIDVLKGYLHEQIQPDWGEIKRWQVCNRTTGEFTSDWETDEKNGLVIVHNAEKMCEYTVSFLGRIIWHPVQIYNYLTNNWTCEKDEAYDPAYPATREYIKRHLQEWCDKNPDINVIRYTTFLYNFSLIFNEQGKEKYVDWFGYNMACSPALLDKFEKETGETMTAEDMIDGGCYNNPFRVPSKKFLKYMDFIEREVSSIMKELVEITHKNGKEAMMFLGDDWIGSEPYGEHFADMNLDAVVGSIGGGVTVRMLCEIPNVKYHEGRFLPYFFPDTFYDGNEDGAVLELNSGWAKARRAIVRTPLDRMGFGGYLKLAAKFPKFIDRVAGVCNEFREIVNTATDSKPYEGLTVAVLNCWGKKRSWMSHMVAHELWYQKVYSYQGVLESLSGLGVKVKFISFDDIRDHGIDKDIDVIINVGDGGTAYSGGENWADKTIVSAVRSWVDAGHGFIGIGEPTAYQQGGRYFALADVLGVDKENSFTLSEDKYNIEKKSHFITEDVQGEIDYGEGTKSIYALNGTNVLDIAISPRFIRKVNVGEVGLAANEYGKGRGVYIAGLPYSPQNARLLLRAMYWASHKESELKKAYSSNIVTDCSYYPKTNKYAVVNNSNTLEKTTVYDIDGKTTEITLEPYGMKWL